MSSCKKIAIIGAGLSGLLLGQKLSRHNNVDISIFEKSRGVGGRLSTRYADPYFFDHGANSFTIQTKAFYDFLHPFIDQGIVGLWQGQRALLGYNRKPILFHPDSNRWTFSPNMNSFCKKLAENLTILSKTEVTPLALKVKDKWILNDTNGHELGEFDTVISTAPPFQTARLFNTILTSEANRLSTIEMRPCFSLMVGFKTPVDVPWVDAKVLNNPLKRIFFTSTKPQRSKNVSCFVAQTSVSFSKTYVDTQNIETTLQPLLLKQFYAVTGLSVDTADFTSLHRWRYATTMSGHRPITPIQNPALGLFATGDWGCGSDIEKIFLSINDIKSNILS